MTALLRSLIRRALKPAITCDLPGHLRLYFPMYRLLPDAAVPYLHFWDEAMCLYPGIKKAKCNPCIGTALVQYDPSLTNSTQILSWLNILIDEGLACGGDEHFLALSEQDMVLEVRRRLVSKQKGTVYNNV